MESLNYFQEHITKIQFDKSYLLIYVDEYSNSKPYIGTGVQVVNQMFKATGPGFDETKILDQTDLEIQWDKYSLETEYSLDVIEEELNELGYSVYELN